MKKKWLTLGLVLVLIFTLSACGKKDQVTDNNPIPDSQEKTPDSGKTSIEVETYKVAMVTDEGGVSDQSFNQSAWEGLLRAEKDFDNLQVSYEEANEDGDYGLSFEAVLEDDNYLMWGIGYKFADTVMEAAINNPDKLYGIVDFSFGNDSPDNLVSLVFKAEQPSFLVGYIAGKMTKTDKVGFIGGIEGDSNWEFDYGFQAGVRYAAKEVGKDIDVLSQYVDSFSDWQKAKNIARNMYKEGIDIIFHAAGGAGNGVIEAAKEQDKWVIGSDRDQNYLAPNNVLTSAMKKVDVGIYNVIELLTKGEFAGGETLVYGLQEGGSVCIAASSDKNVPKEILTRVEELKQEIIEGKIVVPFNEETYGVYIEEFK